MIFLKNEGKPIDMIITPELQVIHYSPNITRYNFMNDLDSSSGSGHYPRQSVLSHSSDESVFNALKNNEGYVLFDNKTENDQIKYFLGQNKIFFLGYKTYRDSLSEATYGIN